MPVITNKKTGKQYPVTKSELDEIKNNPLLSDCYIIKDVPVPIEVQKLKERQQKEQKKTNK